jgi:uncharacterized damage-inducible protein DinB
MQTPLQLPPFLRGDIEGVLPVVSVWLRNLEEVEETVGRWAAGLSPEGFWWVPAPEANAIGGLVRHIGVSSARLYHRGMGQEIPEAYRLLAPEQLRVTHEPPAAVLEEFRENLRLVREGLSRLTQAELEALRPWGNTDIPPVRAIYIFDHIATHAQHHAGQIITTRKLWNARG